MMLPTTLGSKNLPAGLSNVPLRESARRYIRLGGSVSGMWRRRVRGEVLDMTISRVPRAWSPERKSGEEEGFRHFLEACWSGDTNRLHRRHIGHFVIQGLAI